MKKEKIYAVVEGDSGEDFIADEPTILGVFKTFKSAKKCFDEIVKEEIDHAEGEECDVNQNDKYFEITNSDADYHTIIRIVETELKN